jgi:two-component system response regulator FixJ
MSAGDAMAVRQESEYEAWLSKRESARTKMEKLSKREVEVVSLVSQGLPNKSIARELDISVKTIEKHRANAVRKLGVCSTAEMVRIAVTADQLQGPQEEAEQNPPQSAMGSESSMPGSFDYRPLS